MNFNRKLYKEAYKSGYKKAIKESISRGPVLNPYEKEVAMELMQIIAQEFHVSSSRDNSIEGAANDVARGLSGLLDEYCNEKIDEAIMYANDEASYIMSDFKDNLDKEAIIRYIFSMIEGKISYNNL